MGIKKEEDGSEAKPVGEDGTVDYKYVFFTEHLLRLFTLLLPPGLSLF